MESDESTTDLQEEDDTLHRLNCPVDSVPAGRLGHVTERAVQKVADKAKEAVNKAIG